ncbi:MAG: serine/threonine-protein phosphatase [Lachnospiraceae bacterium]|nr:serine/threonine-protein phosphatase [Lachnospiraceae bacterium]
MLYYYSDIGPKRSQNQDNFYVDGVINERQLPSTEGEIKGKPGTQEPKLYAIFDGMGGETAGEKASLCAALLAERICGELRPAFTKSELRGSLAAYYQAFLKAVEDFADGYFEVCGTTCAAALIDQNRMIPFWMGDSRVYLLRDGELRLLTKDHSMAQTKIDCGLLTEEEARRSRSWHVLLSYMGDEDAEFSIGEETELRPGDRIFLCSDGITDACRDEELRELLGGSVDDALCVLKQIAEMRADDNSTFILLDIE